MRKTLLTLCLALLASLTFPAMVGAGTATGIRGVVLDATCYGPCRYPPEPLSPYTGPGLTVAVRSLPDNRLVMRLHPKDGRFAVRVAPGSYRLKARVRQGHPPCWQGEAKQVKVLSGQVSRVRLRVANTCIR
jgi:hypothetical protein